MKQAIRLTIFLLVFTSIYTLLHYYVIGRVAGWLGLSWSAWMIGLVTMLIISYPAAALLETKFTSGVTRLLYDASAVWMGVLTIMLLFVVLGELARPFMNERLLGWVVLGLTMLFSMYAVWNAASIVVHRHRIHGRVSREWRFIVASDLHLGPVHGKKYLERIVDLIKEEEPDAVLLPGDLVDGPGVLPDDLLEPLDAIKIPIFYSFGNHEHYVGAKHVQRVLQGRGVRLLRDEAARLDELTIIGIDDSEDKRQLAKKLPGIQQRGYTILLYHRPTGLEDAALNGVDLMLCGHTHFGQIFPFTLLVKLSFPRIKGWYSYEDAKLFVSTGAGTWGPPMRLASTNEVVVLTITPRVD